MSADERGGNNILSQGDTHISPDDTARILQHCELLMHQVKENEKIGLHCVILGRLSADTPDNPDKAMIGFVLNEEMTLPTNAFKSPDLKDIIETSMREHVIGSAVPVIVHVAKSNSANSRPMIVKIHLQQVLSNARGIPGKSETPAAAPSRGPDAYPAETYTWALKPGMTQIYISSDAPAMAQEIRRQELTPVPSYGLSSSPMIVELPNEPAPRPAPPGPRATLPSARPAPLSARPAPPSARPTPPSARFGPPSARFGPPSARFGRPAAPMAARMTPTIAQGAPKPRSAPTAAGLARSHSGPARPAVPTRGTPAMPNGPSLSDGELDELLSEILTETAPGEQ